MKINQILGVAMAVALAGASSSAFAGAHTGGPEITGEGACTYVQENMFAGPFDVCQEPVGAGEEMEGISVDFAASRLQESTKITHFIKTSLKGQCFSG